MLAYKLKTKRDKQTISQIESQWIMLLEHFEESKNLTPMERLSDTMENPFDKAAIAAKSSSVNGVAVDCHLRVFATHCCTAIVIGLASVMTGVVSSAIAGAYLTGTFATCGFAVFELFRLRTSS